MKQQLRFNLYNYQGLGLNAQYCIFVREIGWRNRVFDTKFVL